MKVCNEIKRRIDEADNIAAYDLDVARHTEACDACRRFAHERAALRELIGSTARVTAPINFEAVLHARLAEVKGRKRLVWLNPAFYLRAGVATAAMAVTVFVAQQMGFFAPTATQPVNAPKTEVTAGVVQPKDEDKSQDSNNSATPTAPETRVAVAPHHLVNPASASTAVRPRATAAGARRDAGVPLMSPVDAAFVDGDAILIPGRNGQRDVTVPTVSVGAQPLIYGNAGRQPQPTRAVTVSF